jgi:hypothetical protein
MDTTNRKAFLAAAGAGVVGLAGSSTEASAKTKMQSKLVEYKNPSDFDALISDGWTIAGFTNSGGNGSITLFVLLTKPA